jgi:hypothetical protein
MQLTVHTMYAQKTRDARRAQWAGCPQKCVNFGSSTCYWHRVRAAPEKEPKPPLARFKSSLTHYLAIKRCHAAETLQTNWRAISRRSKLKSIGQRYRAAIRVQRAWHHSHKTHQVKSANRIQAAFRAHYARQQLQYNCAARAIETARENRQARALQRWYHRIQKHQKVCLAIITIQRPWRRYVACCHRGATKIQALWRAKQAQIVLRKWIVYFANKAPHATRGMTARSAVSPVATCTVQSLVFDPRPPQARARLPHNPARRKMVHNPARRKMNHNPARRKMVHNPARRKMVHNSAQDAVQAKHWAVKAGANAAGRLGGGLDRPSQKALLALAAPFVKSIARLVLQDLSAASNSRRRLGPPGSI